MNNFIKKANSFGRNQEAFFFLIDFELKMPFLCSLEKANDLGILYDVNGRTNFKKPNIKEEIGIEIFPMDIKKYESAFNFVQKNLSAGNTYLINITFPTKIKTTHSLKDIFLASKAKYKLLFKDKFTLFSPETFIKINNNTIYSYPMKGTIDAGLPDAKKLILENKKEISEHNTIVDLIRNDLSIVSKNIQVTKFRFLSEIKTNRNKLLQVSSKICGELPENWQNNIGEILSSLLPAGSISGAPKQKTVEIIKETEKTDRGYFTGIFGLFDGENLDSAVNIRFIEKNTAGLFFRSGGGITAMSNLKSEYEELLSKVYIPV